ncbi:hypothetical protein RhiirA4_474798 [Rhizophagus irregularis]|uniref:Uncharacterized protein n=1 Tax=Rhizophagus irregularis TaxID=588596 RepID=A0A2I1H951_9GLOM|nr:hypothetical protein RhiirA4_474798 [Rhizophagus irregularis]
MTDYNPFQDFWGDLINGAAVAIIATQLSYKTKDLNDNTADDRTDNRNYRTEDMNDEIKDRNGKIKDKIDRTEDMNDKTEEMNDKTEDMTDKTEDMNDEIEVRNDKTENKIDKTEDMNDKAEDKIDNTEDTDVIDKKIKKTYDIDEKINDIDKKINDMIDKIGSWIKAKFAKLAEVMDDIIIMGSLHAINVYLLITWWEHIYKLDKIIATFALISTRILRLILFMIIIILQSVENGYLLSNNFWQTKFSTALATVSIIRLFDIYKYTSTSVYASVFGLNLNYDKGDSNGAKILRLILFTIIIILQSVENGYLLSNNFWQTKFSTALATVSIIRLFDIYRYDGHSVYASVFGLNYDESDSNSPTPPLQQGPQSSENT